MIGFITLTGIAARNGILKMSHTINLSLHEGVNWGEELVMRGSLERLTPVLMTALSAGVALVPLLIDASTPGKEILHPVAVTIFGGLISATLLDAFLTPVLLLRFGRIPVERLRAGGRASRRAGVQASAIESFMLSPREREPPMNSKIFLVIGALIFALPVQAHDLPKGSHGGRIVAASDYHVELVAKDGLVEVFLTDAADKPVMPAGFKGVAVLVSGGRSLRVPLEPADGIKLFRASGGGRSQRAQRRDSDHRAHRQNDAGQIQLTGIGSVPGGLGAS